MRLPGWIAIGAVVAGCATTAPEAVRPFRVEGDAIPERLAPAPGDAARGKAIVASRDSNCLLCHAVPESGVRFMGNVARALDGAGARLTEGQLRLRIVDFMRVDPDTIMPSYYRTEGLRQVGEAWRGKPVLTAQEVEDVVAFLLTLR